MCEEKISAQGLMDFFRLADKELIDKILDISRAITVQQIDGGKTTRIIVDLKNQR
jgi:hypothetical protein